MGPFDFDPCGRLNWPTADKIVEWPQDGLATPWSGRVWLNPPYGAGTWIWLERLGGAWFCTALIFARTETAGFIREVWQKAQGVLFLHGRLHFHQADGTRAKANSGAPSCLVASSSPDIERLTSCGLGRDARQLEAHTMTITSEFDAAHRTWDHSPEHGQRAP